MARETQCVSHYCSVCRMTTRHKSDAVGSKCLRCGAEKFPPRGTCSEAGKWPERKRTGNGGNDGFAEDQGLADLWT